MSEHNLILIPHIVWPIYPTFYTYPSIYIRLKWKKGHYRIFLNNVAYILTAFRGRISNFITLCPHSFQIPRRRTHIYFGYDGTNSLIFALGQR